MNNMIAPSILSADFANLERDLKRVSEAEFIHVDVMDGSFVPNITIGAPVAKAIRKHIKGIMDVHLMIQNPDMFINDFKDAGTDYLTVHIEACTHLHRTIQRIKEKGMKAGVSLNPATPVCLLEPIIDDIDLILIMSVNPGFGGQKFIPYSLEKIKQVKKMIGTREILIQVDGGVTLDNAKEIIDAGATVIVAGSAIFNAPDVEQRIQDFKSLML
ncbi:ribulose-phosphate 3-epimerase [Candidatus Epulonipiscium fishelsonii]|uniref:Ribulose-phosphate 3-epimerase n=1 Tax=Candidatus Epulonipiscium fishelsonii TaxID=77094 RepID=A0ACC8XFQ6_9FIRM|nr:ribulose-phosphate 3-epimerase [Epulopiscium sp. SCG-B11WGA-EpuloA1]ONI42877.1 ribulose-phosphate 3-epimerase [Epulopiscium sp. SCG-B05WGA-EpuloA1]